MRTNAANVRQFLVSWITVLDSVPEIDMLVYLPKFLEGLFKCLGEMSQDIRAQVSNLLDEFLRGIKAAQPGTIDFPQMTRTLTQFCTGKCMPLAVKTLSLMRPFFFGFLQSRRHTRRVSSGCTISSYWRETRCFRSPPISSPLFCLRSRTRRPVRGYFWILLHALF